MKKIFLIGAMAIASAWMATPAQAQLGNLLNQVVGAATSSNSNDDGNNGSNLIGNLIASVTGNLTTTQENLIGTWSYNSPCVQFESENALSNAGGSVIASNVESKLVGIYKKVGIKEGTLVFTFDKDGNCTYSVGKKTMSATYTFNKEDKTISILTKTGREIKIYTTISGSNLALTFDASKLLTLFQTVSANMSSLATISAIAGQYNGMKVGFRLTKQ